MGGPVSSLTAAQLAEMRVLWETAPEMSAAAIGEQIGCTKGMVIGRAYRGKWKPRGVRWRKKKPSRLIVESPAKPALALIGGGNGSLLDRLDALHAAMDAVLAANPVTYRTPTPAEARGVPFSFRKSNSAPGDAKTPVHDEGGGRMRRRREVVGTRNNRER